MADRFSHSCGVDRWLNLAHGHFESTIDSTLRDYIHLDPVRRGFVERPEDWIWPSARWYAGLRPVALEIDPFLPRVYEL